MPRLIAAIFLLCMSFVSTARADIELAGNISMGAASVYALALAVTEDGDGIGLTTGAKQLAYSFAATQLTVQLLKVAIDEERPDYKDGDRKDSFPSGHTATAFSAATFVHKRYGFKAAIAPYMLAGFTGYSRVQADRHHWRDVIAGAAISSLFTWVFVDKYGDYDILVAASPEYVELGFGMRF